MPEVQSGEIDPKEGQESEIADQEEDQLGHLGCLSQEESDRNNQNNTNRLIGTDLSGHAENHQHK